MKGREHIIKVEDMTAAYGAVPVLWDVDLSVPEGVLMAVVGPNGAGKSTLIKCMLGLVKPISGSVRFYGKSYKSQRGRIAYVPQSESVDWDFPANVLDVVLMGRYGRLGWFRRPGKKERELALSALEKLGIRELSKRHISELSGGQQQRVFLARAIVQDADIYFMDEPFKGVDQKTETAIIALLKELRDEGRTIIAVHHDLQTVSDYFDSVALINRQIIKAGPVNEVFTEENLRLTFRSSGQILKR